MLKQIFTLVHIIIYEFRFLTQGLLLLGMCIGISVASPKPLFGMGHSYKRLVPIPPPGRLVPRPPGLRPAPLRPVPGRLPGRPILGPAGLPGRPIRPGQQIGRPVGPPRPFPVPRPGGIPPSAG
jgi:hypothetical protein